MIKKITALAILFSIATYQCLIAQQLPDSTAYKAALAHYTNASGDQSVIFNGYEYADVRSHKGSVFFNDNYSWSPATVVYDGIEYDNIPVLYDSFNDLLVAQRRDKHTKYVLRPDKATFFRLGGNNFTRIAAANVKNAVKDGYYEMLYNGKSSVIAKRSKERSESLSQHEGIKIIFEDRSTIYIKKNDIYSPVKSKNDVLKLFKDKADDLNKYIKSGAVTFKSGNEQAIVQLAEYYDQLSL